jgi:hypothetical protein
MKKEKRGPQHNAIRHGIFSGLILNGHGFDESEDDFLKVVSDWRAEIRPLNELEQTLVEKLACLTLRLRRVYKADFESASKLFARVGESLERDHMLPKLEFIKRDEQVLVVPNHPPFESLPRYEVHLEKQISRTLDQLEQLRRMRGSSSKSPENPHT